MSLKTFLVNLSTIVSILAFAFIASASEPESCISCHSAQFAGWQKSDHAMAMAMPSSRTVLGNFDNALVTHYSQKATFFKEDDEFLIELSEGNKTTIYKVAFTFGHYPLQQYLIPAKDGKYQVFPFAWDSRDKSEGGQRWYPNYAQEDIKHNDRLHWKQPLQNWNGMCADCHSDGLVRNYSVEHNSFETGWDNINVGCQSCHGHMKNHPENRETKSALSKSDATAVLRWLFGDNESIAKLYDDEKLASRTQIKQRQNSMDTCFACHSLRSPLNDGIKPGVAFLDQFVPSLVSYPHYFADGQINDEVYVYGSFLQSKMFDQGVTCLDCHDPHTMKVKTQNNGLCLQCHSAEVYQQQTHIRHEISSEAGQCVTCHMPEKTYMGVDYRRDHSFKVPRPSFSTSVSAPNVCNDCHNDKSANWASQQIQDWYGKNRKSELTENEIQLAAMFHGEPISLVQHLTIINDQTLTEIQRASAIAHFINTQHGLTDSQITPWVNSSLPLIRLATARVGGNLSPVERQGSYLSLLSDRFRSVRVAAAEHLISVELENTDVTQRAFAELATSHDVNSWRGEGNLNKSLVYLNANKPKEAINILKNSIRVDPYFEPAYINLADIYRGQGAKGLELSLYQDALQKFDNSPRIQYSYGLFLVRIAQRQSAVRAFAKAMELDPLVPQYAYLYFLALDSVGRTSQALDEIKKFSAQSGSRQFIQLGLNFSRKLGNSEAYEYFLLRL